MTSRCRSRERRVRNSNRGRSSCTLPPNRSMLTARHWNRMARHLRQCFRPDNSRSLRLESVAGLEEFCWGLEWSVEEVEQC